MIGEPGLALAALSSLIWLVLLVGRGQFWQADQRLVPGAMVPGETAASQATSVSQTGPQVRKYPTVCVVIPARNEAALLPITLPSLLHQDYPGRIQIMLVDDHSTDATAAIATQQAAAIAQDSSPSHPPFRSLTVIAGAPLPPGWTGKLWAMAQGIDQSQTSTPPDYFLLTDADIAHGSDNISQLVRKAEQDQLNLVSLMVQLRCQSFWEHLLIPAFVFFFQKLYPFRWVNDPAHPMAAAAGGCILIRATALSQIGGIQTIRHALIDDCALAKAVKSRVAPQPNGGRIWLGLSDATRSLRAYPSLMSIWDMVARTAFTQLNYSPVLLLGTVLGMVLMYGVPVVSTGAGLLTGNWHWAIAGASAWLFMVWGYLPTLRQYRCAPGLALCLPMIAGLYTVMTVDSARRHWQGRGGVWKGRAYAAAIN